jgi:hypothetical protein
MGYFFKSIGNKEIDNIVRKFDKQIVDEYKDANGIKEMCLSYWSKKIFLETINFDLNDWKKVRDFDYFQERDNLQKTLNKFKQKDVEIKQKKILYDSIIKYKENNK